MAAILSWILSCYLYHRTAMALRNYIWIPFLLVCGELFSQVRTIEAVKSNQAPKIDGVLDDALWASLTPVSGFIQNFPTYGLPVSQPTEVKIAYDNYAIYVGAMLYDNPGQVRKQITARDGEQQTDADYFAVFFDTYNDKQNGFQFLVTSANVQTDAKLGPNLGDEFSPGDRTWDAVWESKVAHLANGWSVEMRIPYISLRFAKKDVQTWGVQFLRFMRRNNESSYWSPVNPQVNGFVNQFGELTSLKSIVPPLRLSFSPYVTTGYRNSPQPNGRLSEWLRNGGMDVKYGLNESFTLDATLVPDFGQVISDNVVNNLTPYEVRFTENRQFFTEGTEIFNKAGLFYSRRIGAIPPGYFGVNDFVAANPQWNIEKNPSVTQLYNATKFSGRTKGKLGIGIFNAVTAPMEARIHNTVNGKDSVISTSSLANYNIVVLDQALRGRSFVTLTNTNVVRNGSDRDANVTALDVAFFNKKNTRVLRGTARYSKIWGLNPYDGYNTTLRYEKIGGRWNYFISGNIESKKYDPNDLGILTAPNEVTWRGELSYRQPQPTKNFITYSYSFTPTVQYLYKPYSFSRVVLEGEAFWVFHNFWDVTTTLSLTPGHERDFFELRTDGKYIRYPTNYGIELEGSTDSRKKLYIRFSGLAYRAPDFNNDLLGWGLGFRFRFSNKFSLDLQNDAYREGNNMGYAFMRESNGDPIVAFRDVKEHTAILSGIYNFTSRMNLTLRVRHYWNEVRYKVFYNVDGKGGLTYRSFIPGRNDNFNTFNADAFLTWDFRLGSRLILGYKNWLGNDETVAFASGKRNSYLYNAGEQFNLRHGNEVTIRFIYFIDYNRLRKKA
ncbi:MAG: carbohydrate binding family 9 domain-containing protein [Chitinophagaceae bacterium]|nr:carbohydrate binding family 9 domain-containing protein [Chitinophagaceae bacterium]